MLCLDDLTHLFNQGDNPSPLGTQNTVIARGPTAHRGNSLVSSYGYLAWGHHFHPAIHSRFDFFGIDPSTAFNGVVLLHDFINGIEHFVIGHLSRDRSPVQVCMDATEIEQSSFAVKSLAIVANVMP